MENKNLKEKIEWLNKDIMFKTNKLNEFLDENSSKNNQNYELRKSVIEKDSKMNIVLAEKSSLEAQLNQLHLSYESSKKQLIENKEQLAYMTQQQMTQSVVRSQYVKERVDDRLNTLYEALQLENAQLKIELAESKTKGCIVENTLHARTENYEGMINSLRLQYSQQISKVEAKPLQEEEKENVEMKEDKVEPQSEEKLNGLKSAIIDQSLLLASHEETWNSLYLDLISCIELMKTLERQEDDATVENMREELSKVKAHVTKQTNIEESRSRQVKNLHEKLSNLQNKCQQQADNLQKATEQNKKQQQTIQQLSGRDGKQQPTSLGRKVSFNQQSEGSSEKPKSSVMQPPHDMQKFAAQVQEAVVKIQALETENKLLKLELTQHKSGNPTKQPNMTFRNLMLSLHRAQKVIEMYEQKGNQK